MDKLREKIKELRAALKADASDLWQITNAIKKEIESRSWILEGRGCYEWDDDYYRDETRLAFEAVLNLIANVQHPAQKRFHLALLLPDIEEAKKGVPDFIGDKEAITQYDEAEELELTPEEIIHLNEQWEKEYEDVEMTDAEWELKRWGLIAKAAVAKATPIIEKQERERIESAATNIADYNLKSKILKFLQALK